MKLPVSERAHFGERASVRVALSLEALERDPDAEMAVLGSPFLGALLEAIRTRAGRLSLGMMPAPGFRPGSASPGSAKGTKLGRQPSALSRQQALADGRPLIADGRSTGMPIHVRNATARRSKSRLATHTVGRLLAPVVLRASELDEAIVVASDVIDLGTRARADQH